jgi:hypothetical protein
MTEEVAEGAESCAAASAVVGVAGIGLMRNECVVHSRK